MRTITRFLVAMFIATAAGAQTPGKIAVVGMISNGTVATGGHLTDAFVRGLAELGYADGKNMTFLVRYAEGKLDRLPALAQELANLKVDVLFAPSALAANAARKAGVSAPIVFALAPDPVGEGFAASLAHPGGNMTGLTTQSPELGAKRVEILREVLPKFSRLAALYAGGFPGVSQELADVERAVTASGREFMRVEAKRPEEFEAAFVDMVARKADAMLVIENPMFFFNRKAIAALAEKHRIPAIYRAREYVASGGLMSYGADYVDLIRRAAAHVDKILKGAKPGDLPVEQPVKFELVIHLGAAKALGLTVPQGLLLRADEVIR